MQSADSLIMDSLDDLQNAMPVEFLNSITVSGLPLSCLALKVGSPLMLLHNLDPSSGLCNGTHLVLTRIKPQVLECQILSGVGCGNIVLIPRISIEPSTEDTPVKFKHCQFPVWLAFAMTICCKCWFRSVHTCFLSWTVICCSFTLYFRVLYQGFVSRA